jgi:hypothetical protein
MARIVKSLHYTDHYPIRIGDERERLVTASPVITKSRAPAGGNNYPENGLVKPLRRDTRALSQAGIFGGKAPLTSRHVRRKGAAPLSGAEEKTARAISARAHCACLLSLQIGSIHETRIWRVLPRRDPPRRVEQPDFCLYML